MKRVTPLFKCFAVVLTIGFFSSCLREYSCDCDVEVFDEFGNTISELEYWQTGTATTAQAEEECDMLQSDLNTPSNQQAGCMLSFD